MELIEILKTYGDWGAFGIVTMLLGYGLNYFRKDSEALRNENKILHQSREDEKSLMQDKIDNLNLAMREDLKMFSDDKTKSMVDLVSTLSKQSSVLEHIKNMLHDRR